MKHSLPLATLNAFDRLYASIPAIACKGLCHDSCGMVPMTEFEWKRMVARHGKVPGVRKPGSCPFLTTENRCQHHDIRPTICRLWGVVDDDLMRCPHGCEVERMMAQKEPHELMAAIDRIGGGPVPDQMEIVFSSAKQLEENPVELPAV